MRPKKIFEIFSKDKNHKRADRILHHRFPTLPHRPLFKIVKFNNLKKYNPKNDYLKRFQLYLLLHTYGYTIHIFVNNQ